MSAVCSGCDHPKDRHLDDGCGACCYERHMGGYQHLYAPPPADWTPEDGKRALAMFEAWYGGKCGIPACTACLVDRARARVSFIAGVRAQREAEQKGAGT